MKLDWHKAKPITFEFLRGRYSYGDLEFAGLTIAGVHSEGSRLHIPQLRVARVVGGEVESPA